MFDSLGNLCRYIWQHGLLTRRLSSARFKDRTYVCVTSIVFCFSHIIELFFFVLNIVIVSHCTVYYFVQILVPAICQLYK